MKRELYSREFDCNGDCLYCFAKWGDYKQPVWGIEQHFVNDAEAIIYPCCDGEFLQQKVNILDLWNECKHKKNYISISTKHDISDVQLAQLEEINYKLLEQNKGFVKIGVSFTTKYKIEEIEKGTLAYEARIQLLQRIMDRNLRTCVVLKPILPFITTQEYLEIVEDSKFAKKFLLGDLYVDKTTNFYNEYVEKSISTQRKHVGWLNGSIEWDVVEQKEKKEDIIRFINKAGCKAYDSDTELIYSLI